MYNLRTFPQRYGNADENTKEVAPKNFHPP